MGRLGSSTAPRKCCAFRLFTAVPSFSHRGTYSTRPGRKHCLWLTGGETEAQAPGRASWPSRQPHLLFPPSPAVPSSYRLRRRTGGGQPFRSWRCHLPVSLCSRRPASPRHLRPEAHLSRASGLLQRLMGKATDSCLSGRNPLSAHPHSDPRAGFPSHVRRRANLPPVRRLESHEPLLVAPRESLLRSAAQAAAHPASPPSASSRTPHGVHLDIPPELRSQLYLARQRVKKCGRDQGHLRWRAAGGPMRPAGGTFLKFSYAACNEAGKLRPLAPGTRTPPTG